MKLTIFGFILLGVFIVDSVKVSIYYESLCPDSIRFITTQLYPAYYNVSSVIQVDFVPYGKANHSLVDGSWEFECQHGEQECLGNKYQACALAGNHSQDTNVEFVACVMGSANPADSQTISNCASATNISFDVINQCFENEGGDILAALGDRTHLTENTQVFVPTIIYDDVFNQTLQSLSLTNFTSALCSQVGENQLLEYCRAADNGASSLIAGTSTVMVFGAILVNQW